MAKKIKFPLEMKDGVSVRTLEELQENFCLEKVLEYFKSGKLQKWLEDRYYEDEIAQLEELEENQEGLARRLAEIFGVEYQEQEEDALDKIMSKQEKLRKLRQYTDDEEILNQAGLAAFDQEELAELLDEDAETIFLCENRFVIPLRKTNRRYVGVGNAVAVIKGKDEIRLDEANIVLDHVTVVCPDGGHVVTKEAKGLKGDVLQKRHYEIKLKSIPLYYKQNEMGKTIYSHLPMEYGKQWGEAVALYSVDQATGEENFVDVLGRIEEGHCSDGTTIFALNHIFSDIEATDMDGLLKICSSCYKEKEGKVFYWKPDQNEEKESQGLFCVNLADNEKEKLANLEEIEMMFEDKIRMTLGAYYSSKVMAVNEENIIFQVSCHGILGGGSTHGLFNFDRIHKKIHMIEEYPDTLQEIYSDDNRVFYTYERAEKIECCTLQNKVVQTIAKNVRGTYEMKRLEPVSIYSNGYLYYVRFIEEGEKKYFVMKYDVDRQVEERAMELPSGYGYTYNYAFFFEKDGDLFLTYHTSSSHTFSSFAFVPRDSHTIKIE